MKDIDYQIMVERYLDKILKKINKFPIALQPSEIGELKKALNTYIEDLSMYQETLSNILVGGEII